MFSLQNLLDVNLLEEKKLVARYYSSFLIPIENLR